MRALSMLAALALLAAVVPARADDVDGGTPETDGGSAPAERPSTDHSDGSQAIAPPAAPPANTDTTASPKAKPAVSAAPTTSAKTPSATAIPAATATPPATTPTAAAPEPKLEKAIPESAPATFEAKPKAADDKPAAAATVVATPTPPKAPSAEPVMLPAIEAAPSHAPATAATKDENVVEAAPVAATPEPKIASEPTDLPVVSTPPAPPEPLNDLAIELGWNAPAEFGVRYLRRIGGTGFSFGAGLGLLTFWGPKISLLARHQEDATHGLFEQVSFDFTTGDSKLELPVTTPDGTTANATFQRTPGRTFDALVGWRFDFTGTYLDLFLGASLNLQGTWLQTTKPPVQLSDVERSALAVETPGGVVWGASYGWLW